MRRARLIATLLVSSILGLSLAAFAATQPPATTPKPVAQAGAAPPPLTKLAMNGKGYIKEDVRKSVRDSDIILRVNWPYMAGGPHSCSLYSLGKQDVDPLMFSAYLKERPDAFMYMGVPEDFPSVEKGTRYEGNELDGKVPLVVTADSPCCFIVQDETRTRPGSVMYGAFQDAAGDLWVYQESLGSYFTDVKKFISMHNDQMAPTSQKYFKAILAMYLDIHPSASGGGGSGGGGSGAPCPAKNASNFEVGVNHHVDTGIKVAKGDKITIRASGEVTFGIMAGSGGPEGINFLPGYNYFTDYNHGCLIGRIHQSEDSDDPWFYIGTGVNFTADRTGLMQFNVNDNDPDNNVGEFKVDITVCRQR